MVCLIYYFNTLIVSLSPYLTYCVCHCYICLITVRLVIIVDLIFCGLGSSDDFVGLYFHGVPPLIT